MFNFVHKNRKGFTMVELLITVIIVGLLVGLAGTALYLYQNHHTSSAYRWRIQNAVQLASTKFETNTDLITNSKQLDIFYDDTVANGILYDETTGTFEWKDGKTPYVFPDEGTKDGDYSYIFSAPAWDKNDTTRYLGYYLFIKNYNETTSTLFLDDTGFGETPVQIELSIATDELEHNSNAPSYQSNGVKIIMKSGNEELLTYQVETVYVLENFSVNKQINYSNGALIFEADWFEGTTGYAYPCGWCDETINGLSNKTTYGYPSTKTSTVKDADGNDFSRTFTDEQLQTNGNVLRFLSPLSDMSVEDGEGQGTTSNKASCIGTWTFSDGTEMSERVLDNLRNFRDEVLRGTEIGDWFIEQYYYVWSPFLIENTAFLKPVYKAVLEPLSYICNFIAEL